MIKPIVIISILLVAGQISLAHPLHVSVLNISIEEGRIELTMKTFVDDWELAYFHYHGKEVDLKLQEHHESNWLSQYLNSSLKIKENNAGAFAEVKTDSIWFEDMSVTIEMHIDTDRTWKSIFIENTLLIDIFPDQSNLTILSYGKKQKGIKFDYEKHQAILDI